jgi:hypothetical protein
MKARKENKQIEQTPEQFGNLGNKRELQGENGNIFLRLKKI